MSEITREQYQEYLQGDHWRTFSFNVKVRRPVCEHCGCDRKTSLAKYKQGLHVHHKTYERIGHELPADVEVLCFACHLVGEHDTQDVGALWKILAAHIAMPAVERIRFEAVCLCCGKIISMSAWNFDELGITDGFYCAECS